MKAKTETEIKKQQAQPGGVCNSCTTRLAGHLCGGRSTGPASSSDGSAPNSTGKLRASSSLSGHSASISRGAAETTPVLASAV